MNLSVFGVWLQQYQGRTTQGLQKTPPDLIVFGD